MNGQEIASRVDAVHGMLADFEQAADACMHGGEAPDWEQWTRRLAGAARSMTGILRGPAPAVTLPFPDGSAFLTTDDVLTALASLQDASYMRCNHPDDGDKALIARYRALARSLGADMGSDEWWPL